MQDVTFSYEDFDPESEGLREALTSTGNGYFCTRGTAIFGGSPVLNEDLVNLPNCWC